MKRAFYLTLIPTLWFGGCFYVAPLEQEDDPEDTMPTISVINPGAGVVEIDLATGTGQTFVISDYGDDNLDQPLYHRIVMDFRPAGVTANAILATVPKEIPPQSRDAISYLVRPCDYQATFPGAIEDGRAFDLYVLLSDEAFLHQNEKFQNSDYQQVFETSTGRGAVFIQWTVLLHGACSE